ncbi:MAG TPA: FliH/SctL family protein [Labilithrix sp.]|nr:FliH/SctL family protein [Labilithrix sp.]
MTLEHARVIKGAFPTTGATMAAPPSPTAAQAARASRTSAATRLARAAAERIVAEARREAATVIATAAEAAASEAREKEVARLAASFLALRHEEAGRLERELDRLVELAVIVAERLIGEAIRVEPARIAALAASALMEARGARRVRIDASPEDIPALTEALGAIGQTTEVTPDTTLGRGSLVVHTDLGRIDARLEPQLSRLAVALREALR